jgi:hypothetical protein
VSIGAETSIMRIVEFAATGLLVPFASAQSVSPKLASIIPPDTALIYSIDRERYADSALQSFYPMAEESAGQCPGKLRQIIFAERAPTAGGGKLMILRGANVAPGCASADETNDTVSVQAPKLIVLETGTAITGDQDTVRSALERWQQQAGAGDGDLAAEVRQMSETYDNWFIAIRPLHAAAEGQPGGSHLSYRSQFTDMVEEVRAGIRLGKINEVEVEVEMKTPEDATAAAGLGRWLRGLLQTRWGPEAALAEVAEDLSVTAAGKVVSLSFTLDSAKVRELSKEQRAMEKAVDPRPDAGASTKH